VAFFNSQKLQQLNSNIMICPAGNLAAGRVLLVSNDIVVILGKLRVVERLFIDVVGRDLALGSRRLSLSRLYAVTSATQDNNDDKAYDDDDDDEQ